MNSNRVSRVRAYKVELSDPTYYYIRYFGTTQMIRKWKDLVLGLYRVIRDGQEESLERIYGPASFIDH